MYAMCEGKPTSRFKKDLRTIAGSGRDIGPLLNYDRDHDVLRIRFPLPSDAFSYDDEEYPGIYVSRSEKDNRFTVFDYSRRFLRELKLLLPMVEWDEVSGRIH